MFSSAAVLLAAFAFLVSIAGAPALPTNIGTVFMIGLENHNFQQPSPATTPQQIFTNPAAPYINSLITPGNSNATCVSYCTRYYNTGVGVHPSEPNYIWEEAGSNLGVLADGDPSAANSNLFTVEHFVHQLDAAGISWHNYEEDVEYTTPMASKSGTRPGGANAYNGSTQFSYVCRHNPMCFWTNSAQENVTSLTNLLPDLTSGHVARYNWIMPDLQNCMHTATSNNFTYHGITYTGGTDQCAIAEGDNFLSIIVPQIMSSPAFQSNGVIIIRFDESEGGDTTNYPLPEIIISPLAKGSAYASGVVLSHSSDLKTMEEIFGLNYTNPAAPNYLSNAIPSGETAVTPPGAYNNIGGPTVNDLSDLFASPPGPPHLTISLAGSNSVVVTWPSAGSNTLLQNSLLTTTNWVSNTSPITTTNGANSITIPSPAGSLFFRLSNP